MSHAIELSRRNYLPAGRIEILFIAEARPADPDRFFYFDQVDRHDWLYLALIRVLFADAHGLDVKQLRKCCARSALAAHDLMINTTRMPAGPLDAWNWRAKQTRSVRWAHFGEHDRSHFESASVVCQSSVVAKGNRLEVLLSFTRHVRDIHIDCPKTPLGVLGRHANTDR
jgi:hypothetical protein